MTISNFEIPPEIRSVAEQSVEQAKKAFEMFIAAAEKAQSAFEDQAAVAQAGAKDVGKRAVSYAEQNVANYFNFAQKLLRAKDVQEVVQLQSEFIKAQLEALTTQARELGGAAAKAAADAAKPKS